MAAGLDKFRYRIEKLQREIEANSGSMRVLTPDGSYQKFRPDEVRDALLNAVDLSVGETTEVHPLNQALHDSPARMPDEFLGVVDGPGVPVHDLSEQGDA